MLLELLSNPPAQIRLPVLCAHQLNLDADVSFKSFYRGYRDRTDAVAGRTATSEVFAKALITALVSLLSSRA